VCRFRLPGELSGIIYNKRETYTGWLLIFRWFQQTVNIIKVNSHRFVSSFYKLRERNCRSLNLLRAQKWLLPLLPIGLHVHLLQIQTCCFQSSSHFRYDNAHRHKLYSFNFVTDSPYQEKEASKLYILTSSIPSVCMISPCWGNWWLDLSFVQSWG